MKRNILFYGRSYHHHDYQWLMDSSNVSETAKNKLISIYRVFRTDLQTKTIDNAFQYSMCFVPIESQIFVFALGILNQRDRNRRPIVSLAGCFFEKSQFLESEEMLFNLPKDLWSFWFGFSEDAFMELDSNKRTAKILEIPVERNVDPVWLDCQRDEKLRTVKEFTESATAFPEIAASYYRERQFLPFFVIGYLSGSLAKTICGISDFSGIQSWRNQAPSVFVNLERSEDGVESNQIICEIQCEKIGFFKGRKWVARCISGADEKIVCESSEFQGSEDTLSAGNHFDRLINDLKSRGWTLRNDRGENWFNRRLHKS